MTASEPAGVRLGRFPPISEDRIAQGSTETPGEDSRTWKPASPTASTGASVGPEGHTGGAVGALQAPTPMGQGLGTMGPALAAARSGCFEPYEPWFAKQLGTGGDADNKSQVSSTRTLGPGSMRRKHPLWHQTQRRESYSCSGTSTRPSQVLEPGRGEMPPTT